MGEIKKIGVLTSGGDAPGMNAALRAVVRSAIYRGITPYGISHGYNGLIEGDIRELQSNDVSNTIQRGGTILGTARSKEFKTPEGRKEAYENLRAHNIDAVVVIGGDGTFTGAGIFGKEYDIPFVGIPGTIDNDMYGTDHTIGFDTALNTVVESIDRIKDTASSHGRLFFIEVMGRNAGFIAMMAGISTGAEAILIPERRTPVNHLREFLETSYKNKKTSGIVIVAEGDESGGAFKLADKINKETDDKYDIRVTVLGHIQRGGSPSAFDRYLASMLAAEAVDALLDNLRSIMVGYANNQVVHVSFNKTIKMNRSVDERMLEVASMQNF